VLVNVSDQDQDYEIREAALGVPWPDFWVDSLSERSTVCDADSARLTLAPYEVLWLEPSE
jgi:hypothetical protein